MKSDSTISNIIADIKVEMDEEFDVDISVQEINDIVSSQFNAAIFAFNKGIDVRLSHFGRFDRNHKEESAVYRKFLKEIKDEYGKEEHEKAKRLVQELRLADKKERAKNRKTITLDELLDAPYHSNIANVYNKVNRGPKIDINDFFNIRRRAVIDKLQRSQNHPVL